MTISRIVKIAGENAVGIFRQHFGGELRRKLGVRAVKIQDIWFEV